MKKPGTAREPAWFAVAIAFVIPMALCLSWHWLNSRLPVTDAADYLTHGFRTLDWFREGGLLRGVAGMYLFRFWKPILHPAIAAPVLLITGMSVPATVALYCSLNLLILLYFSRALAGKFVDANSSLLVMVSIGTLPFVSSCSHLYMTELPFMALSMAAAYFLADSDFFSKTRSSLFFAIFFALSACIRPVEALLLYAVPMFTCALVGLRKGHLRKPDLVAWVACAILVGMQLAFLWPGAKTSGYWGPSWPSLIASALPVLLLAVFWRKKLKHPFFATWATIHLVILGFYGPFRGSLYSWIYQTTFGPMARTVGNRNQTVLNYLANYWPDLSLWPLLAFCAIGLFGLELQLAKRIQSKRGQTNLARWALGVSVCGMLLPFPLGMATFNGDPRYYYTSELVLILASLIFALWPGFPFLWGRQALVGALVLLQITFIGGATIRSDAGWVATLAGFFGGAPSRPEPPGPDPQVQYASLIHQLTRPDPAPKILVWQVGWASLEPNMWSMELAAETLGFRMFMDFPLFEASTTEIRAEDLKPYDYLFAGPLSITAPNPRFGLLMLRLNELRNQGTLSGVGLEELALIPGGEGSFFFGRIKAPGR